METDMVSQILPTSKWELETSTRKKFTITGLEYKAILASVSRGVRLVSFKDMTINPAHIVSVIMIDNGFKKITNNKFASITEDQRVKNLENIKEIRKKILKKYE